MDTFRLNPDAVRRAMPAPPTGENETETETGEAERLVERVRETEERIPPADRPTAA